MYEENQTAPDENVTFSRRDFVLTSLITCFALAVQPINAQDKITTDDKGLVAGEIRITRIGRIAADYLIVIKSAAIRPIRVIRYLFHFQFYCCTVKNKL